MHNTLGPSNIGFYTNNPGQFVVEPGAVDVHVGDSSLGGLYGQYTVHQPAAATAWESWCQS